MPYPTADQLTAAVTRWGLDSTPTLLRQIENFVYNATLAGRPVILRLTDPARRTEDELAAEFDWMDYLATGGLQVARPIRSKQGSFVESLSGYFAALFELAPGKPLREASDFTPTMLGAWGAYIGRMHRLTRRYRPSPGIKLRHDWDLDVTLTVARRGMDPHDRGPCERFEQLISWLRTLERDEDCYGLIHADMHHGNFFVDAGRITAFDFDDACRHWFTYDLAVPLFTMAFYCHDKGTDLSMSDVSRAYLRGYATEYALPDRWLARVDSFIQFRIVLIYHWVKVLLADGTLTEVSHAWSQKMLGWCREQMRQPLALR